MENYLDDFISSVQCDEFEDPAEGFNWDDYYVDDPKSLVEESDDNDPGYLDIDWLYEELHTYEIDGDF